MEQALAAAEAARLDVLAARLLVLIAGRVTPTSDGLRYDNAPHEACAVLSLPLPMPPRTDTDLDIALASLATLEDTLARLQRARLIQPLHQAQEQHVAYVLTLDGATEAVGPPDACTIALGIEHAAQHASAGKWRAIDWERAIALVRAIGDNSPVRRELALYAMLGDPHGDGPRGAAATRNVVTVLTDTLLTSFQLLDQADSETAAVQAFRHAMDIALAGGLDTTPNPSPGGNTP